ncbi:MAG: hypothetical protein E7L44_03425 [Leuconostoc citreum]|uniref:hypothetical protein n=1 Tax=uncultured Leuconostoc sp. TaxID=173262 RepID=UPI0028037B47|nr:hypothetical protein [uncultured Leuconostoc sp.]MDU7281515.1 hypothetical protein [Leuconostoc citreum]
MMKLSDFQDLTQFMSNKSLIFWQNNDQILAIGGLQYLPDSPNICLETSKKAMTLSQLTARLQDMGRETQLYSPNLKPIYGFHLDLEKAVPKIILK